MKSFQYNVLKIFFCIEKDLENDDPIGTKNFDRGDFRIETF